MFRIKSSAHAPAVSLPLFADRIPAGFPSPAADFAEEELDFNELLIRRRAATYCLRVSGDSMQGAGILPGDILVVDRSVYPLDSDIVVASLDGEFTVKRLITSGGQAVLRPENPAYRETVITEDRDFLVFGVVTGVVRTMKRGRG